MALLLGLLLLACARPDDAVETRQGTSPQTTASPELSVIDSLMWQRPDSALTRLLPCFDTCCRDGVHTVSTAYNCHYAHLLLAELLYKNYCEQSNRPELQQVVQYFDSLLLADTRGVSLRRDASHASALMPPQTIAFLDARAHYINGVGYYENDSMVEACAEYLKALEIMEEHFGEKEMVRHKARFMANANNRLGDMFSEQFMMESAIACYKNALVYCRIEPTSPQGVSNILYRIGKQYDMMDEVERAREYYGHALEEMRSCDNLSYRDLASSMAFSNYLLGLGMEQSMIDLRQILVNADDESEKQTRFLTIGAIFAEEGMYDSAMFYLEPVFENEANRGSQIIAAECLRIIYDSIRDDEKLNQCLRFLALQKKSEGQNKALVSQLESLFQNYLDQKQEKSAKEEREKAVKKALNVIIPFDFAVALVILVLAKLRSKKLLKDKEKRHQQEMETERQTHKMQQVAMSGRLKRSNEELRELKDQIQQQEDLNATPKQAESFTDEPICRLIMERVKTGQFKSKVGYLEYKDSALSKQQVFALRAAADQHYGQFTVRLKKAYPQLTKTDLDYCCLYLLGLSDADVSALMQRAYNTVIERNGKLKKIFGNNNPLPHTLMVIAKNPFLSE